MELSRMTQDDVLFGYRLQLFDLAARTTVSNACRVFGVHRSTFYVWKRQVERSGLEMLRPRERRRPQMPNQLSPLVEQRIVAFALGQPGLGPKRIAARLRRPEWGGLSVSPNGVYKALRRHGLNTRAKRLGLVAGYRAPYEPPREPAPEPHPAGPTVEHTSARNEFGRRQFDQRLPTGTSHTFIRAGRPQTNGHVERLHRTILEECWRPAFARFLQVRYSGLKRHLADYLDTYNHDREHHGRITQGRRPSDLVYGARKMEPR